MNQEQIWISIYKASFMGNSIKNIWLKRLANTLCRIYVRIAGHFAKVKVCVPHAGNSCTRFQSLFAVVVVARSPTLCPIHDAPVAGSRRHH